MVFLFFFLVNNQTKRMAKKSSLSKSTSVNPKWEAIGGDESFKEELSKQSHSYWRSILEGRKRSNEDNRC